MAATLSGHLISILVGVTASQFLLGFSSPNQEVQILWWIQVGIQSPEGITTIRGILRRFNDFLKLFSEVKKAFPSKYLPPAPPKKMLKIKSRTLLEERRCFLEDWMENLLSDIDVSRSALVATFLELEAAARSSFYNENQQTPDVNSSTSGVVPLSLFHSNSDVSALAGSSFIVSDHGNDTPYEISEVGTPTHENSSRADLGLESSISEQDLIDPVDGTVKYGMFNRKFIQQSLQRFSRHRRQMGNEGNNIGKDEVYENKSNAKTLRMDGTEFFSELGDCKLDGHVRRLSTESVGSDLSSARASEILNIGAANLFGDYHDPPEGPEAPRNMDSFVNQDSQLPRHVLVALPSDERHKLNRVLVTMQRRLATAKADLEDLIARLNQEVAVRQFLTTKVKDLEGELETTRQNCKDNMEQAVLTERERFTQMQWDMEELRGKCLEMELKLKSEQDERIRAESTKIAIIQENKMLLQELYVGREQLENLKKHNEEFEVKSKADVKLLVKEVKSLRSSQLELKQELSRLMKEKLEVERSLQREKQRTDNANTANAKLLHECGILRERLQECSVNFLVEEEDKLIVDTSSPSDAIDLLTTSDNRIGLLLAEAQLLAQDVENAVAAVDETSRANGSNIRTKDDELRKMLTDVFVDNARLRIQVNSVLRCALANATTEKDDEEEEEVPLRKTVLSKFLER
ncbi:hypothetical protein F2P56_016679 [Juglans regia]|uniref:PX domain-containing protein n=2 Tax=Juglans regia TaxID=51240 RepID=A0A833XHV2_JUGRE|nr:PX domain-containing protein EREX-like isoform X2 [Juglans regia]KAF5466783.1 hypothetical protein F2P56_016679 [Juglans regia]